MFSTTLAITLVLTFLSSSGGSWVGPSIPEIGTGAFSTDHLSVPNLGQRGPPILPQNHSSDGSAKRANAMARDSPSKAMNPSEGTTTSTTEPVYFMNRGECEDACVGNWTVDVGGISETVYNFYTATPEFNLTNGVYPYAYTCSLCGAFGKGTGEVTVDGAPVTVVVRFNTVVFEEVYNPMNGPFTASMNVSLNGFNQSSKDYPYVCSGICSAFGAPNGTGGSVPYSISLSAGYNLCQPGACGSSCIADYNGTLDVDPSNGTVIMVCITPSSCGGPHYDDAHAYSCGLDVSSDDTVLDWGSIRAQGYVFAFVRATLGKCCDYDHQFAANMEEWQSLYLGPYGEAYPHTPDPSDALSEAQFFVEYVNGSYAGGGTTGTNFFAESRLPPVLAMECTPSPPSAERPAGLQYLVSPSGGGWTSDQVTEWALTWLNFVQSHDGANLPPLLYTSSSCLTSRYFDPQLNVGGKTIMSYGLWIADYSHDPPEFTGSPWQGWDFFQYTETGAVPSGIAGAVDLDLGPSDLSSGGTPSHGVALPEPGWLKSWLPSWFPWPWNLAAISAIPAVALGAIAAWLNRWFPRPPKGDSGIGSVRA
jgi:GH25 family lysozyme M1 (1,4-beta-N-acetylmuramidase)